MFGPPPVRGVGRTGGFKIMIEDRGDVGLQTLQGQTDNLRGKGQPTARPAEERRCWWACSASSAPTPRNSIVDLNRQQCMTLGVALADAFDTLQIYLGSLYVNDFNLFGRTWQVIVQADADFRNGSRTSSGSRCGTATAAMVPLGTLADVREVNGPLILTRYNMYPAAAINGSPGPGVSSGQAIDLDASSWPSANCCPSMHYEWTEMAYLELQAGNTAMVIFGFAVVMVFLVLAAQYESWSLPLAVILVVPMCLLSAVLGVTGCPCSSLPCKDCSATRR